jgi:hypothetical protein
MTKIISSRTTDRNRKKRPRRLPPLRALWTWALIHVALTLSFLLSPPPAAAISAAELPQAAAISTAAELPQAELDARAPLIPEEAKAFGPGKAHRTARRVLQVQGLLSQGGAVQPTVRHIARVAGVSKRTVQRAQLELEGLGVGHRVYRRLPRQWTGPRGQKYRTYNEPNRYRFPLRRRNLRRFVTPSRNYLKTTKANTPQKLSVMWKSKRRTRPDDHPAEFRAAWERRRRANHPPELRERYEAQGEVWAGMRQWRRNSDARIFKQAREASVGTGYASEAQGIYCFYDRAERMGLSSQKRRRHVAAELRAAARDAAAAISWAELDQVELAAAYVAEQTEEQMGAGYYNARRRVRQEWTQRTERIVNTAISTGATDDEIAILRAAGAECEAEGLRAVKAANAELDQADQVELETLYRDAAERYYAKETAEPDKKKFVPAEIFDNEKLSAELDQAKAAAERPQAEELPAAISGDNGESCPLCDGKMRRVVRGIIVVCKCVR